MASWESKVIGGVPREVDVIRVHVEGGEVTLYVYALVHDGSV